VQFEDRRKLLQLEALYDVGRALNTLRPEGDLLEELMHRAIAVLDASVGFVFSVDEQLQLQHPFVMGLEEPGALDRLVDEPAVREVMISRAPVMTNVPHFLGARGGAFIAAPMLAGDRLIGVLGVVGKEARGGADALFAQDDVRFLESLGAIGAAAIDNTRNFHRVEMIRESLEDENRSLKQRMLREYSEKLMIGDSPRAAARGRPYRARFFE
jgi:GAF domain-containing protein